MKIRHYLITAFTAYFIFLIYSVPAAPVINLFTGNNKAITVSNIDGTLWSGSARSVRFNNHEVHELDWNFTIWRLFTGEISFEIEALFQDNAITATVGSSLTDTITIHNLTTTISAYSLGKIIGIPIGELAGQLNIRIDNASWTPRSIPLIEGALFWEKAAIIIAEKADLGELSILISEEETSPLNVSIENKPGHLDVTGNVGITDEGNYQLEITLKPTSKASMNLRNSLKLVGKQTSTGDYKINKSGNLSQLGLM